MKSPRSREALRSRQLTRSLVRDINASTMNFAEVDQDGDQLLDFEEFHASLPRTVIDKYTPAEIRAWFDAADTNGDGTLCINEFFRWSLSNAARRHGAVSLAYAFQKYDRDGTGMLDADEFAACCEDLGFGAVAYNIFRELDTNCSGSISYGELSETLAGSAPVDTKTKQLFAALTWESAASNSGPRIDTSSWVIRGQTVPAVRATPAFTKAAGKHRHI